MAVPYSSTKCLPLVQEAFPLGEGLLACFRGRHPALKDGTPIRGTNPEDQIPCEVRNAFLRNCLYCCRQPFSAFMSLTVDWTLMTNLSYWNVAYVQDNHLCKTGLACSFQEYILLLCSACLVLGMFKDKSRKMLFSGMLLQDNIWNSRLILLVRLKWNAKLLALSLIVYGFLKRYCCAEWIL